MDRHTCAIILTLFTIPCVCVCISVFFVIGWRTDINRLVSLIKLSLFHMFLGVLNCNFTPS